MNAPKAHKYTAQRGYTAAMVSLSVLLISSLLFPDTLVDFGFKIAGFRISPISLIYFVSAPAIVLYIWSRRKMMKIRPVDAVLLLMWTFMLFRNFFAIENNWELGLLIAFAIYLPVLYFGGYALGRNQHTYTTLFTLIAAVSVIISLYALIEFFLNENILLQGISRVPIKSETFHRSSSTLGHPLILGLFLVQTIPFLVYSYMKAKSSISQVLWGAGIFLSVNALFISYTKGSWLTIGLLATGFVVVFGRRLSRPMLLRFAIIILLSGLSISLLATLNKRSVEFNVTSEDRVFESVNARWIFWKESVDVFQDKPLLGTGLRRGPEEFDVYWEDANSVGNIYIRMFLELGIIGVSICLAFFVLLARKVHHILKIKQFLYWESLTIFASMMAVAVQGMAAETFLIWVCFLLFFLEAGLVRAIFESQRTYKPDTV